MAKKTSIKNAIKQLKVIDLAPVKNWISTGCTILDLALSDNYPGGFAMGRITHIYGDESTAKTALVSEALGAVQRQGGIGYIEDAEQTFDFQRAADLHGLVADDKVLIYATPETLEELFDEQIPMAIDQQSKRKKTKGVPPPAVMAIDSLAAMPTIVERDATIAAKSYGMSRAKQMSLALRKCIWPISKANIALLFVDQSRTKIGVMFGDNLGTSSGKAIMFYSSTRLRLTDAGKIKNKNKIVIGVKIRFKVVKNKVAPPFRMGVFRFLFQYGIDDVTTNVEWCQSISTKSTKDGANRDIAKFLELDISEKKLTTSRLVKVIEDANKEDSLRILVAQNWKIVHKESKRKKKARPDVEKV